MSTRQGRIFLSPPHVGEAERARLLTALESGWVAPLGPDVDAFEQEVAEVSGRRFGAATNSGTAALHLALRIAGVGPGDEVLMPSLTFVATANAGVYLGARPVFVDVDPDTWTLDPRLVADELSRREVVGRPPAAVVAVDLYGQCADYQALTAVCGEHGVPLVIDSAESLGATYRGGPSGSGGVFAVFSFNGNKIITTSGGGMLVGDDEAAIAHARALSAQCRLPVPHYEHAEIGYNYRLSNLLAAVGRAQLADLPQRVARRREINVEYRRGLAGLPGVDFMPVARYGEPSHWLTVLQLDPEAAPCSPTDLCVHLEAANVESRPAWKPLHLQPVFAESTSCPLPVSERIFTRGLCLPSGSDLTEPEQDKVITLLRGLLDRP